jgi:3-hydroxy-9,10-secoandrosta-1,3,5(10)-triene-9,17-dione monooxygenase reductase component
MFLVCVDRASDTLKAIQETGIFCVNVLAQGQEELSNRFAKKGDNKFSGVKFRNGSTGAPILTGALLAIECTVEAAFPGGDHEIFCGKVERIETEQSVSTEPLLYYDGRYGGVVAS